MSDCFFNNKTVYVKKIEKMLISYGLSPMSTYFGDDHIYENDVPAKHLFWDKDEYYYCACQNPSDTESAMIWYSKNLEGKYELLDEVDCTLSDAEIVKKIGKILDAWKPEQEIVLKKYIDLYAKEPFPYHIQSAQISLKGKESGVFLQSKWVEPDRIEYNYGLCPEMDRIYREYEICWENEDYESAYKKLSYLYEYILRKYGKHHDNFIALLYELGSIAEVIEEVTTEDILSVYLFLYRCLKDKYGNNHDATIGVISYISSIVSFLGEHKDGVILAKYVQKAFQKKYGKNSRKSIAALKCIAWQFYDWGRYGKAERIAEECIELGKENHVREIYSCYQCIAHICRAEKFEDYEKALKNDLLARKYIELYFKDRMDKRLDNLEDIAMDYKGLGNWEYAKSLMCAVVKCSERFYGSEHWRTRLYLQHLSDVEDECGREEK